MTISNIGCKPLGKVLGIPEPRGMRARRFGWSCSRTICRNAIKLRQRMWWTATATSATKLMLWFLIDNIHHSYSRTDHHSGGKRLRCFRSQADDKRRSHRLCAREDCKRPMPAPNQLTNPLCERDLSGQAFDPHFGRAVDV